MVVKNRCRRENLTPAFLPQFTDLIASGMQGEDHQIEREQTSPCLGALLNRKYGLVATVRHSPYKNRMWN